jgi:hypothetical protein
LLADRLRGSKEQFYWEEILSNHNAKAYIAEFDWFFDDNEYSDATGTRTLSQNQLPATK